MISAHFTVSISELAILRFYQCSHSLCFEESTCNGLTIVFTLVEAGVVPQSFFRSDLNSHLRLLSNVTWILSIRSRLPANISSRGRGLFFSVGRRFN